MRVSEAGSTTGAMQFAQGQVQAQGGGRKRRAASSSVVGASEQESPAENSTESGEESSAPVTPNKLNITA